MAKTDALVVDAQHRLARHGREVHGLQRAVGSLLDHARAVEDLGRRAAGLADLLARLRDRVAAGEPLRLALLHLGLLRVPARLRGLPRVPSEVQELGDQLDLPQRLRRVEGQLRAGRGLVKVLPGVRRRCAGSRVRTAPGRRGRVDVVLQHGGQLRGPAAPVLLALVSNHSWLAGPRRRLVGADKAGRGDPSVHRPGGVELLGGLHGRLAHLQEGARPIPGVLRLGGVALHVAGVQTQHFASRLARARLGVPPVPRLPAVLVLLLLLSRLGLALVRRVPPLLAGLERRADRLVERGEPLVVGGLCPERVRHVLQLSDSQPVDPRQELLADRGDALPELREVP
mmetsp:Transcript_22052/g.65754  ORF Transcript_22052/g.65754 Transcript_22052/m.65754 type:complete len:342 (-) Transcript_22052:1767-2792(-)